MLFSISPPQAENFDVFGTFLDGFPSIFLPKLEIFRYAIFLRFHIPKDFEKSHEIALFSDFTYLRILKNVTKCSQKKTIYLQLWYDIDVKLKYAFKIKSLLHDSGSEVGGVWEHMRPVTKLTPTKYIIFWKFISGKIRNYYLFTKR